MQPPQPAANAAPSERIAVLLPLTGSNAPLGHSMLDAIRLATGASDLDVEDTAGTTGGATQAAGRAVAGHSGIILGPLTAAETQAAAAVAAPAGVPILAFTSDRNVARPGVWVLGLTAAQQVERLLEAARASGLSRPAGFLPENTLGDALGEALSGGAPGAPIRRHDQSFASINDGLKVLSDFSSRHANEAKIKADHESADPAVRAEGAALAASATPVPPVPFDALLLGDTGTQLQEVIDLLNAYDIQSSHVRLMGPTLWGAFARKLGQIAGAWYAAPDPAARSGFVAAYEARFHSPPLRIDDFAYDAGALAAALAVHGGFTSDALTRPDGFAGTDGVFSLAPDGHVQRGLAVFQIDTGGGAHIVSPAPTHLGHGGV